MLTKWRAALSLAALTGALAIGVATMSSPTTASAASTRPTGKLVPATGAYLGAFSSSGTWSGNQAFFDYYSSREALVGRRFDIANHFYGWTNPIPSGLEQWDQANGRLPLITWQ